MFVARRGAHLAAERSPSGSEGGWSEEERSGAKWRGRGLGQRNKKLIINALFVKLAKLQENKT